MIESGKILHVIYLLVEMRERVNEEVSKLEYCSPTGWLVGWLVGVGGSNIHDDWDVDDM